MKYYRLILSGYMLIFNIKNIEMECERINVGNHSIAKCYYSNLEQINAVKNNYHQVSADF